jgi:hypothetical protein
LQTNTSHIVIGYLNDFLQTKHTRLRRVGQFLKGDLIKRRVRNISNFISGAKNPLVIITWHKARTKSTIAFPSNRVEPVKIRSTATTTL